MTLSQQIANKIEARLKQVKMSRSEFAFKAGVHPGMVTKWLKGDHNFTVETLERIQDTLMMSFITHENIKPIQCFPCEVNIINDDTQPHTTKHSFNSYKM